MQPVTVFSLICHLKYVNKNKFLTNNHNREPNLCEKLDLSPYIYYIIYSTLFYYFYITVNFLHSISFYIISTLQSILFASNFTNFIYNHFTSNYLSETSPLQHSFSFLRSFQLILSHSLISVPSLIFIYLFCTKYYLAFSDLFFSLSYPLL